MVFGKIRKRDGRVVPFDKSMITKAIFRAACSADENNIKLSDKYVLILIDKINHLSNRVHKPESIAKIAREIYSKMEDGERYKTTVDNLKKAIEMLIIAIKLTEDVIDKLSQLDVTIPDVEVIQDIVEKTLIENGHAKTAKEYILYRAERQRVREMNTSLMKLYEEITFTDSVESDTKRENANINGDTPMGLMLKYGSEGAKKFNLLLLMSEDVANAHKNGDIHIHDLDFYNMTTTCCQIDLDKLFTGGFNTGHGYLREPAEIRSYAALACIAIQSNQNDQHGGQSIPMFDYYMAPGVAKTLIREILRLIEDLYDKDTKDLKESLEEYRKRYKLIMNEKGYKFIRQELKKLGLTKKEMDNLLEKALKHTDKQTYQAMEAFIHNLNSMHSRAGSQVPFSSINYGTDTSEEGRMIIKNLLLATDAGLGYGETPIFPIQIFKLKSGINLNDGDPNYDLFKLACKVSAKRLFPNFSNLDAPYNKKYLKDGRPETETTYMGCRTRVIGNVYDPTREIVTGRGNLSFTTINLPRLGLLAEGDIDKFFNLLEERLLLVERQLLERFKIQCMRKPRNFPFLMGQGVWIDSDKLGHDDDITEILKHGTLSIGFIGLAETLTALIGKHHGESDDAQKLGLKIIKYIRDFADRKSQEHKMNFTCLATPAEGLAGRFISIDKKKFGIIPGVTDKDYYTNSFHVPVRYKISAFKKIKIEAPYHELCNAGHITYIEIDGDPSKNIEAFEKIVRYMHKVGIGYGAINHPVDRDPICGYTGIINDVCPRCGRREGEPMTIEMWNRIKGYTHSAATCGACGDYYEELDRIPNTLE